MLCTRGMTGAAAHIYACMAPLLSALCRRAHAPKGLNRPQQSINPNCWCICASVEVLWECHVDSVGACRVHESPTCTLRVIRTPHRKSPNGSRQLVNLRRCIGVSVYLSGFNRVRGLRNLLTIPYYCVTACMCWLSAIIMILARHLFSCTPL